MKNGENKSDVMDTIVDNGQATIRLPKLNNFFDGELQISFPFVSAIYKYEVFINGVRVQYETTK